MNMIKKDPEVIKKSMTVIKIMIMSKTFIKQYKNNDKKVIEIPTNIVIKVKQSM